MNLKRIGPAAVAALALMAFVAGTASATTLEIGGVVQSGAVMIQASATAATVLTNTSGAEQNTCTVSSVKGTTSVFTGTRVTGSLSELSFKTCALGPVVADAKGGLYIQHESGTTSGEVFSENAQVTVPIMLGLTVTCSTGSGTRIGTVDAASSASSHATMTISAVLSCGVFLPSAPWKGTYKISTPTGLGFVP